MRKRGLLHRLATWTFGFEVNLLLRLACRTIRLSTTRLDILQTHISQGHTILAFWHSRLFYLVYYYAARVKRPKTSILLSRSRDGDYGAALVDRLGQDCVRGSSSRGALSAVRALAERLGQGQNIAITLDGPRGPACRAKIGVIKLAQMTGARIIPASYDASRKTILGSWDSFILPWPFGRAHLALGEPITIPQGATATEMEHYRKALEDELLRLDRICAEHTGTSPAQGCGRPHD